LDVFAPGVGITSSWNTNSTAVNTLSGTSMATPHVAGAAALYLSSQPGATPAQVAAALTGNATPNKVVGPGTGSVNKLLYSGFIAPPVGDATPPTASLTAPAPGQTLVGNVTLKANAADNVGVAKVEFFANNTLLGTATASPYQLSWNTASLLNGSYSFTAKATDTSSLSITSTPVLASIANPVTPPACSTSSQLIVNPGFESGAASWTATSGVITNSASYASHGGSWKAKLNGYGVSKTDYVYQQISIPVNACSANLSFWLMVTSNEATKTVLYDTLTVRVLDTTGKILGTLATYSNLDKNTAYVQKTVNLLPFKGKTVILHFQGVEDSSLATWFLVDDTNLNVMQ
jgi:subtilisin family serine protease